MHVLLTEQLFSNLYFLKKCKLRTLLKEMCSLTHTVLSLKCKLNRKNSHMLFTVRTLGMDTVQNNLHTHTEKL